MRYISKSPLTLTLIALAAGLAAEDVVTATPRMTGGSHETTTAVHSWEAEPIIVTPGGSTLREEDRIGSYGQPRWTARRRFTETRAYVRPEGQIEFEAWLVHTAKRNGNPDQSKQVYELEIGLPHRFQLDLYQVWEKSGTSTSPNEMAENSAEIRYALADWGVIPTNPTLYVEYKLVNGDADVGEVKLLLADEITERWHWAANLVYEGQLGGEGVISREIIGAVSYTILDENLSVGAEAKFTWEDVEADRGNYEKDQFIGPNIQFRPLPQAHINVAYLVNTSSKSVSNNAARTTVIFGWEF
jgi:hypothetical protein